MASKLNGKFLIESLVRYVPVCTWKVCPLCGKLANFPPFSEITVTWEWHGMAWYGIAPLSAFNMRMCFWHGSIFFPLSLSPIPSFIFLDAEKCGSRTKSDMYAMCAHTKKTNTHILTITFVYLFMAICSAHFVHTAFDVHAWIIELNYVPKWYTKTRWLWMLPSGPDLSLRFLPSKITNSI